MLESVQTLMGEALAGGSLLAYLFIFLGGVMASFTPCTYPVLPLTVGFIGNTADGNRGKAALLSTVLVTGMALVYAVVGVVVAAAGSQFGALWANGLAVFAISWFFILMSLMLMDVFSFPMPKCLSSIQSKASSRRDGVFGAFLVGGVSGLVVGPCTGPILMVVLVSVGTNIEAASGIAWIGEVLNGGFMLFLFGLGQGALILLCGIFAGLLTHLPKSGKWMVTLKKGFALLILAGASLLLVYAGQATDFPDLTRILATAEGQESPESLVVPPAGSTDEFGGDEFLE